MEKEQLRLILSIAKAKKKKLYKNIWKNYSNIALLDWAGLELVEDRMPQFLWDNYDHKNYARELKVIYLAMEPILNELSRPQNGWYTVCKDRSEIAKACERLHKRYWNRFHKVYAKKAKENGGWPHMNRTHALREFLAMGYVYKTDTRFDEDCEYKVYTHIGGLWWPESFPSHNAAIAIQNKYGIPGYTGTTIPK